jgi:hypothetical protein
VLSMRLAELLSRWEASLCVQDLQRQEHLHKLWRY